MGYSNYPLRIFGTAAMIVLLAGCGAPAAAPTATQPLPPPLPPPPAPLPPPKSPMPPPTPAATIGGESREGLFNFIRTVQVAPDDNFPAVIVGFSRINYVPATDRFIVTFEAEFAQPSGGCTGSGYAYKEYNTDLQATGKTGVFSCVMADSGSLMIDNTYYFATASMSPYGFRVRKLDAATWTDLAEIFIPLEPKEKYTNNDPTVAYVDGKLDISSQYNPSGSWPDVEKAGAATFHEFLTPDLQPLDRKILDDTPHICGMSMFYADGVYYLVTANAYAGDLVVMRYDKDWKYLGVKTLIEQANWSTGLVFDGSRFYLSYLDTRQRNTPGFFPVYLNVHLAAFDRDWNLVEDLAVTNYAVEDNMQAGRPWVILQGDRLYVSYDLDKMDPVTRMEMLKSQAMVSVYELAQQSGG